MSAYKNEVAVMPPKIQFIVPIDDPTPVTTVESAGAPRFKPKSASVQLATVNGGVVPSTSIAELTVVATQSPPAVNEQLLSAAANETVAPVDSGDSVKLQVTNSEFIAAIYQNLPDGAFAAICTKPGDPTGGGWVANRADTHIDKLSGNNNNYVNGSSFYPGNDGSFKAQKGQFAACLLLMLDDVGTKVPFVRLGKFKLSALIETSGGNHQGIIILAEPITDGDVATRLLNALIDAGLCDPGASGPLTRWVRLPVGINGKSKHADKDGAPFRCRIVEWNPDARYTPEQIVEGLQLELPPAGRPPKLAKVTAENAHSSSSNDHGDDVYMPKPAINPTLVALKSKGLYKKPLGSGKHDITCPWVGEHTDALDSGSAYFEPDDQFPHGGYCCQHSHGQQYRVRQLLDYLGVDVSAARHKTVIRIIPGELHRVVFGAERELAHHGQHYKHGGLICSISTDATTGDTAIVPTSLPALTQILSVVVTFEIFNAKLGDWVRCDPPTRHVSILDRMQDYRFLPPLAGVARQPYFRESDGKLIAQPGYDTVSHRFGVFDPREFVIPEITSENALVVARAALAMLEELLLEFHFVTPTDKAASLSAIFTAVVRPTLDVAPAFHTNAHVIGSGKSYHNMLIGLFAGPAENQKVSYPTTAEEATKSILSLLLTSPAVIDFDDMTIDWIPHGVINRMLTATQITDRILGVSKTATVSTRTLLLGSGNNVGPVRDLLRRVATIHLDPRCATPSTLSYSGNPVEKVRNNRGAYVAAVLTIILAWRMAGSPRSVTRSIVTYGGAWTQYCREPLMWLGHPDPATSLIEQVTQDPDAEAILGLMREWHKAFGSMPTTVRKAVTVADADYPDLLDAIREFPVEERGVINRSKLGWILKRNANRIVDGFEFQQGYADSRVAWRVVAAAAPGSPPSPPFSGPGGGNGPVAAAADTPADKSDAF